MARGIFPVLEGGGGEGNRTVLMRLRDILSTSLASQSLPSFSFGYRAPPRRLLSSSSQPGFASPSQRFGPAPFSSPFFLSSSFSPCISPQQRPRRFRRSLASPVLLELPGRSFCSVSSLGFVIFPKTDRSFSSPLRCRTDFRRGVRTQPKPTQDGSHPEEKTRPAFSKTKDTPNAEKKEEQGYVISKADEHLTASLSDRQSHVVSEEDSPSRESSLRKRKNKKRTSDPAEKTPRAQSLEEGHPSSVSRRIGGKKRRDQGDDTSPCFSSGRSLSGPDKPSPNEPSSSSSSPSSPGSEPSSTSRASGGSEGEGEEASSSLSAPVSFHASLVSVESPYSRFDCMRTSQEEPLLKDALRRFKSIVKEQTERRGGKGWHVYEGWPPRSRIPLGNEQSKVIQLYIHPSQ